jgi:hypothetical protein
MVQPESISVKAKVDFTMKDKAEGEDINDQLIAEIK